MAVSEEKMLVLKMLEEGKISSEEAARLIDALENSSKQTQSDVKNPKFNFQQEISKVKDRVEDWKQDFKSGNKQKDFDRMVDDFSSKAEKLGKNVASTTFGIVDKVVDFVGSFVDTNVFTMFGSYNAVERTFEALAAEGMVLEIEGINGFITVKKHENENILIKSKVKSPYNNVDDILMFSNSENVVSVKLNKIGNISVSHEIYLPATKFGKIRLDTSNSRIYVEDAMADSFEAATRNAHIELMGVCSEKMSIKTKNARIQISYITGKDIEINTNNSVIDIKHVKAENIQAVTVNGRILVENVQNYDNASLLNMDLKTANGGIKVNMNDMDNRGYKITAKTTNGGINLLIPQITYNNVNKQGLGGSFIQAESVGYNDFPRHVEINAETQNGYIEVVK